GPPLDERGARAPDGGRAARSRQRPHRPAPDRPARAAARLRSPELRRGLRPRALLQLLPPDAGRLHAGSAPARAGHRLAPARSLARPALRLAAAPPLPPPLSPVRGAPGAPVPRRDSCPG